MKGLRGATTGPSFCCWLVTANPNVASGCPPPAGAYAIAPPASAIPATASITAIAIVTMAIAIVTMAIVATATAIAIVTSDGAAAIVTPTTSVVTPATTTTAATDKCHDTGRVRLSGLVSRSPLPTPIQDMWQEGPASAIAKDSFVLINKNSFELGLLKNPQGSPSLALRRTGCLD